MMRWASAVVPRCAAVSLYGGGTTRSAGLTKPISCLPMHHMCESSCIVHEDNCVIIFGCYAACTTRCANMTDWAFWWFPTRNGTRSSYWCVVRWWWWCTYFCWYSSRRFGKIGSGGSGWIVARKYMAEKCAAWRKIHDVQFIFNLHIIA